MCVAGQESECKSMALGKAVKLIHKEGLPEKPFNGVAHLRLCKKVHAHRSDERCDEGVECPIPSPKEKAGQDQETGSRNKSYTDRRNENEPNGPGVPTFLNVVFQIHTFVEKKISGIQKRGTDQQKKTKGNQY